MQAIFRNECLIFVFPHFGILSDLFVGHLIDFHRQIDGNKDILDRRHITVLIDQVVSFVQAHGRMDQSLSFEWVIFGDSPFPKEMDNQVHVMFCQRVIVYLFF